MQGLARSGPCGANHPHREGQRVVAPRALDQAARPDGVLDFRLQRAARIEEIVDVLVVQPPLPA
eukprot:8576290-Pyramimonas_sp.AAC.1